MHVCCYVESCTCFCMGWVVLCCLCVVLHLLIRFQCFDMIRFDRILRPYHTIVKYDHIIRSKHCRQIESAVSSLQNFRTFCTHIRFQQKIYHCKDRKTRFLYVKRTKYINCCIEHYCQLKYVVMSRAMYD